MYKVLIVDDEVLVRVGLKTTIDWEEIGFVVVAEASNGEQGYEQYKKHLPDVVVTDIKMPRKDGLWLIEEIRKENQDVKILVLTCYDEFSFARKALKLGADDYILKSEIEDEELIAVMTGIKDKIDKQYRTKDLQNRAKNDRNDMKRSLLNDMIKTGFNLDDKMIERCSELEFVIDNTKFALVNVRITEELKQTELEPDNLKQINSAIANIIFDQLLDKEIEYLYNNNLNNYILLMSSPIMNTAELKRIFKAVSSAAGQYFDRRVNIIYTTPFDNFNRLPEIYKDFMEKSEILFYENEKTSVIADVNTISFKDENVFYLKEKYNHLFNEYIGKMDDDQINKLNKEVSNYFRENNITPRTVKVFYSNLIGDIFDSYGEIFEGNEKIRNYEYYHYNIINSASFNKVLNLFSNFIVKVIGEIKVSRNNHTTLIVNRAINYIKNNYDKKISLEDIAAELNISKQYLCNVFRNETGETTSAYINKLRIEKAKKMLLKKDYGIKEIFEDVGFSNQFYFSKVFKKVTGLTITEYRDSHN